MPDKLYIAIDGGGTKTAFAAFSTSGQVLRALTLGPTNPNDIGMDACLAVLGEGLAALNVQPVSIFAGIAGASVGENKTRIGTYLKKCFPCATVSVESDGVIALSADPDADAVLIAGTGSVLFAKTPHGPRPVGGFGYLLEAGGSAYCLGRDALMAALADAEGTGAATALTGLLTQRLGVPLRAQLASIYQGGKPCIAALAPLVFTAHATGDAVAGDIISENCKHLQSMVQTAHERYGACRIALCGGLFAHQGAVLLPILRKQCTDVDFADNASLPLMGAARGALLLAGVTASPDFAAHFDKSYANL